MLPSAKFFFSQVLLMLSLVLSGCGTLEMRAPPVSTPMPEGRGASAPIGHVAFCHRHASECARPILVSAGRGASSAVLTPSAWDDLETVNIEINQRIKPVEDIVRYNRREYWTMPLSLSGGVGGDCEDYALEKRHALVACGWSARHLRLAVVNSDWTGPHTVLVAVTDRGDFVLDNLTDRVKPWRNTPYEWRKRQSGEAELAWVAIEDGPQTPPMRRGVITAQPASY